MSQRQRFNLINQVPFSGPYAQPYPLPFNYGAPQPYPLPFNYGAPQPHLVPQQFHNQSTNNDRSWIDKAFTYRAFTQNQQAPQPNNQQRVPQIQARFANYPIPNQQAPQPNNQQRVPQIQAHYTNYPIPNQQAQKVLQAHAPYSRSPVVYPPISVNQHPFNYPRGVINPSQAFNARAQSNQQSSTPNDSRNFQPVSIYHNPVYGHQTSFSPGYSQGFVAQRIPIQPYYAQPYAKPHAKPYAQNGRQSADSLVRQGYTNENQSKGKMVALSDQVNVERMAAEISNQSSDLQIEHEKYITELEEQSRELEKHNNEYTKTIKRLETTVKEARAIFDANTAIFDANAKTTEALIASTNNPTVVHIQEGVKSTMGFISGDAHSSCQEDRSANNPVVQLYETNKATDQTNQSSTSWPYSTKNLDDDIERHVPSSSPNISLKQLRELYPNFFKPEAPLGVIGEGKPQEHEDLRRQKPLQTQKPLPTQKTVIWFGRA